MQKRTHIRPGSASRNRADGRPTARPSTLRSIRSCARLGRNATRALLPWLLALALVGTSASADPLPGDLNGDGVVDTADEAWLQTLYGAETGDPLYDPAADGNDDGRIDHRDLGLFGTIFGTAGGDPDTVAPELFVSLNDIPDDQNDLLVAPPGGFEITISLDSLGGSLVDVGSLSVTSTQELGGIAAGGELASLFTVTPTDAVYSVPPGAELARTSHWLSVSVSDVAGNSASDVYGFAVRDFGLGAPFASLQTVFLDFEADRSLGADPDFLEDLREMGLSSTQDPVLEVLVRDRLVDAIVVRARDLYGLEADGSPGPDPVNIAFETSDPGGTRARLCVGGQSSLGALYLGAAPLDPENLVKDEDTCGGTQFGVFPSALDNLWAGNTFFQIAFGAIDPDQGGIPIGESPLDATVLDPGFDLGTATPEEIQRFYAVESAIAAFGSVIGTVVAHETGHLVGLVAHGPAPAGLYGGTSGARADHNVTPTGVTPSENWVMNAGGSFTFDTIAGFDGSPLPVFRPLAQAYLRDRIALSQQVTGLFPAPTISQVTPNPAVYPQGGYTTAISIEGTGFLETPYVDLLLDGHPTWDPVQNVTWVSESTLTGTINVFVVLPGVYDVRVSNPDGQVVILEDSLTVVQE
ncbi:MAG: dockerin type I domain-containing protein [Myxococcota bacterium]